MRRSATERSATELGTTLAAAIALAYPVIVWFGLSTLPPWAFVLLALACLALRFAGLRKLRVARLEKLVFIAVGLALVALLMVSQSIAVRAYPVAISLGIAAIFGLSLGHPPTIVERIARLSEPDLPAAGVAYTRKVTWVWVAFLLANASIAAWTMLYGSLEQWTLWNGLLSYLAMGVLFAGEFVVRRMVRP